LALILCGLLLALALYLAAIYGISWTTSRHVNNADAQASSLGVQLLPSFKEVAERHSIEWLIGFFGFYLLLGLTGFPLWQQLGMGAVFALWFGSVWFNQSGRNRDPGIGAGRRFASDSWYWLLAVADWLGFMWTLCFASAFLLALL
jgi:hypothetical protein